MIHAAWIREQFFHASIVIKYVRQLQPGKYYPGFISLEIACTQYALNSCTY